MSALRCDRVVPDRVALDRLAARAWPALDRVERDGWLLRAARTADGRPVTQRANSALTEDPDAPLAPVLAFYRERGLPPQVQVSDPLLADRLAAEGWERRSPTVVLAGPLPAGSGGPVDAEPDEDWLATWWQVGGHEPAGLPVARRCLAAVEPPAGYASVRDSNRTVAVGRGVVEDGHLGVFSMAVLPSHRRRGAGRQVLGALAAWAAGLGAHSAYLQVEAGNDAARALYDGAGLVRSHDYAFWRHP